jgi:ABC-type protease/lipase transport system fused ATPase/permease subunit
MTANLAHRWEKATTGLLTAQTRAADITGTFKAMTKSSRLLLQSGVLGLGAYLALQDQISAGMMLAASIISARALAPVEQMIGSGSAAGESKADRSAGVNRATARGHPAAIATPVPDG